MSKNSDSKFVKTHLDCPGCGHKKCFGINSDGSGYCFSCQTRIPNYEEGLVTESTTNIPKKTTIITSSFSALPDRKISEETTRKFNVTTTHSLDGSVSKHHYSYYNEDGDKVATKTREVKDKKFSWEGNITETVLFGQQLFKDGKYLTITEGECDAMAVYQLSGGFPVVSIKNGAGNAEKDIRNNLEFVEGFDNVVLCFDNDKAGREASQKVARLLKPGKAKIMSLPKGFKDPNDMLVKNEYKKFVSCFWNAKKYTPTGVINVFEKREAFHKREKKAIVPFAWNGLNRKIHGLQQKTLLTLTSGSGLGKSSVTRELTHHLIKQTDDNIGIIALEEDWRRTVDGVLSIEANTRLYIDHIRDLISKDEIDSYFDILKDDEGNSRLWIHSHFGTNDIEEIFSKLRFMIIGCNCKWVIVDHLHMLVCSTTEGDERRTIDAIMTRLRSIVEETGAGLILVSHLRRIDGNKGHENGIQVNLSHLRGSQSIAQLSDTVIALERNQQAEDIEEANTTVLRVLKSRYTGDVGYATSLVYDRDTGRLHELQREPFEKENGDLQWI